MEDCGNSYCWNEDRLGTVPANKANLRPRMLGVSNPFYHSHIFHWLYQCLSLPSNKVPVTSSPGPNSTTEWGSKHKEDFSLCEFTPVTLDMIQVDDIISSFGVSAKLYPVFKM